MADKKEKAPRGFEKWRVRQLQRDRARIKRADERRRAEQYPAKKKYRERGFTGLPQIITEQTAAKWSVQFTGYEKIKDKKTGEVIEIRKLFGRHPKNKVTVIPQKGVRCG
jgi:hypothetical protein